MKKHQLNVCLGFMGQTEEALTFYSKVFNVPVLYTMKYKDFSICATVFRSVLWPSRRSLWGWLGIKCGV